MLTGRYATAGDRPTGDNDFRAQAQPRFQPGNFENNLNLVEAVKQVASQKECDAAQVALAWVLQKPEVASPIVGATKQPALAPRCSLRRHTVRPAFLRRATWRSSAALMFAAVIILNGELDRAEAQSIYKVSLDERVGESDLIVEGRVVGRTSSWNRTGTLIYTVNKIKVYRVFAGSLESDHIEVATPEDSASAAAPPSSAAMRCSKTSQVGFITRV